MLLLSVSDAKRVVGKEGDTELERLERLVLGLSSRFAQYLNRTLDKLASPNVRTEYFHGGEQGRTVLSLKAFPNIQDLTIYDDPNRDFSSVSIVSATDYYVEDATGLIYTLPGRVFLPGVGNIKVNYNGGFPLDEENVVQVTDVIRLAFEMQLRFLWQRRDSLGVLAFSHEGGSVTQEPIALLPEVRQVLQAERRHKVGN